MSRDELFVDLNPVLREIGRLVFNFNAAEHALRRLAFVLIDPHDERVGEITLDRLGAAGLEELVLALAAYRLSDDTELVNRVSQAVKRFGDLRVRRNGVVHAIWVLPNDSINPDDIAAVRRQFRRGLSTDVSTHTPEVIAAIASEAAQVGEVLENMYLDVRGPMLTRP